jgi:CHAT domain-containing protein
VSVGNMARTYAASGDLPNAIAFQRRSEAILETRLALNLAVGSERQKLAFARGVAERTDRSISLNLNEAPDDPDAARLAALVLLQRKGRVLDAMTGTFARVRRRVADAGDRALLDQLRITTTEVARLALEPAEGGRSAERDRLMKDLETRKERLEAELSEHSAELHQQVQPVTVEAVQRAIPADAALVEYAVFRPFDPRAERNGDAYGPPHYAAYILRRYGAPRGVDLGGASAIDHDVEALREGLRDPKCADWPRRARVVAQHIMRPLHPLIGDATRLLVSPDGDLNFIPFEALVDEHGHYLIERYAINYLTSGRDLLRMNHEPIKTGPPVVVANPLFGEPPRESGARPPMYFAPLGGTAAEASAIATLFPSAKLLTGRLATKDALQRLNAPRVLHIASHGFFLPDDSTGRQQGRGGRTAAARAAPVVAADVNPLLRSGLALAGANVPHGSSSDGILTALEASSLNLWGTKLVTLSACDTGIGEVKNGEGVYGLRRAFVLAGTETLVMSLWQVSDAVAREMMVTYYTRLRAGLGRGDALRQAKLAMLRHKGRQHPYYWASFIQSGEWASLDGARRSSARAFVRRLPPLPADP